MKAENKYEGQRYPMWFNFKIKDNFFIVDIAHIEPVEGLEINTGHEQMRTIRVKEVLETRDKPRSGTNHFDPRAKFYTVKAIKV